MISRIYPQGTEFKYCASVSVGLQPWVIPWASGSKDASASLAVSLRGLREMRPNKPVVSCKAGLGFRAAD